MNEILKNNLSSKALLVQLNFSAWTGKRQDKRAAETIKNQHETKGNVGHYMKSLLPLSKELADIHTIVSRMRNFFYEQTAPWMSDGARIIKATNHLKFNETMNKHKRDFEQAINDFLLVYPKQRLEAQSVLGSLFNELEYPSTDELRLKFCVKLNYMPLPDVSDFRTEISDEDKKAFLESIEEIKAQSLKDAYKRLHTVIKNAADRLGDSSAIFKDSLIENIKEMSKLIPELNIVDDMSLDNLACEALDIASVSPDLLRDNKIERSDKAKKLKDLENKLSVFL